MTEPGQSQQIISVGPLSPPVSSQPDGEGDDLESGLESGLDAGAEVELREGPVPISQHAERLDLALAALVPEFSRTYLQQLIEAGAVRLAGQPLLKPSAKVKAGQLIQIELRPTPQSQAFKPEVMALDVVHEDAHLLVINKPAGLVVHPAPGNWSGTLLNGLLARDVNASTLPRAGIVHRLDKDTSGLMVVARTRMVMDRLVQMIANRSVNRQYIALAHTPWQGARTRQVDFSVGRDVKNRLRMAVVDLAKNPGKTASTTITLLENGVNCCLVRCKLHTGRTHQIRVHMAAIGHPLMADELYGGKSFDGLHRQALHACELAFEHPVTGASLRFKSSISADMHAAMLQIGLSYNQDELP